MKAIILAAGEGKRMGKYTKNLPKGMLEFNGQTLIEWQIQKFRKAGIYDINIVTGYFKEKINYPGIKYFYNPDYNTTNMVESMICAREILNSEIIITYADLIFTDNLLKLTYDFNGEIGVAVDRSWRDYWFQRYGTTENDLESLIVKNGIIKELGKPLKSSLGIDFRYIGMIRFSGNGIKRALQAYDNKKVLNEPWLQSGNPFRKGYMTDLLNELILTGDIIQPIISNGGWLEFDTAKDYEISLSLLKESKINHYFFD